MYWNKLLLLPLLLFIHHHHHRRHKLYMMNHRLNFIMRLHQKGPQVFQLERSNQGVLGGQVLGVTAKSPLVVGISILVDILLKQVMHFFSLPPFNVIVLGPEDLCKVSVVLLLPRLKRYISFFFRFWSCRFSFIFWMYIIIIVWVATKGLICSDPLVVSIVIARSISITQLCKSHIHVYLERK